jgi:hypothetical protein
MCCRAGENGINRIKGLNYYEPEDVALFAGRAVAGVTNHLGRTREAAAYERAAARLKAAARDGEVAAKPAET